LTPANCTLAHSTVNTFHATPHNLCIPNLPHTLLTKCSYYDLLNTSYFLIIDILEHTSIFKLFYRNPLLYIYIA